MDASLGRGVGSGLLYIFPPGGGGGGVGARNKKKDDSGGARKDAGEEPFLEMVEDAVESAHRCRGQRWCPSGRHRSVGYFFAADCATVFSIAWSVSLPTTSSYCW